MTFLRTIREPIAALLAGALLTFLFANAFHSVHTLGTLLQTHEALCAGGDAVADAPTERPDHREPRCPDCLVGAALFTAPPSVVLRAPSIGRIAATRPVLTIRARRPDRTAQARAPPSESQADPNA